MQHYGISWEDALHYVQNRRYCISPNGGFMTQIKEYEAIYKAKQAVAAYPPTARGVSRRKREDEDEDGDEREDDRKRALVSNDPDPVPTRKHDPDAMET
ncbi:hypothetical protein DXG03_007196, partial [Asterophora parasitica]